HMLTTVELCVVLQHIKFATDWFTGGFACKCGLNVQSELSLRFVLIVHSAVPETLRRTSDLLNPEGVQFVQQAVPETLKVKDKVIKRSLDPCIYAHNYYYNRYMFP
ncbi:hypothetical protein HDU92_007608, partial [Lobulomyces angularis]